MLLWTLAWEGKNQLAGRSLAFPPLLVFSPATVIIQAGNIIIETTLLSSQLLISSFLLRRFVGDNTNKGGKDTSQLCIYFRCPHRPSFSL